MNMEPGRHGYYGLFVPDSPRGQRGLRLTRKPLSRRSRSHSALMDAAADEGNAALTPFKRTLPSLLHLHLKGQFTQITQHLDAALDARGEFRFYELSFLNTNGTWSRSADRKEGGHPSESLSQGRRLLPRAQVQRTYVNYFLSVLKQI